MHVLVFATDQPTTGTSGSPFVAIPDSASAALTPHPQGLQWTYFATMAADDVMLSLANDKLSSELQANGYFIWQFPHLKASRKDEPVARPVVAVRAPR